MIPPTEKKDFTLFLSQMLAYMVFHSENGWANFNEKFHEEPYLMGPASRKKKVPNPDLKS